MSLRELCLEDILRFYIQEEKNKVYERERFEWNVYPTAHGYVFGYFDKLYYPYQNRSGFLDQRFLHSSSIVYECKIIDNKFELKVIKNRFDGISESYYNFISFLKKINDYGLLPPLLLSFYKKNRIRMMFQ